MAVTKVKVQWFELEFFVATLAELLTCCSVCFNLSLFASRFDREIK